MATVQEKNIDVQMRFKNIIFELPKDREEIGDELFDFQAEMQQIYQAEVNRLLAEKPKNDPDILQKLAEQAALKAELDGLMAELRRP